MSQQTTDVLEQKARECLDRIIPVLDKFNIYEAHKSFRRDELPPFGAAFARDIVKECAKAVCLHCQGENVAYLTAYGWRHRGEGFDALCLASAIWEDFGRKEEKKWA